MTRVIDKATWPRRECYTFFSSLEWPFYTLTLPVEVTALRRFAKAEGLSFYLSMVYAVTKSMERVEGFRYKCRGEEIVLHDRLIPSFTDLTPGSEQFHITTLEAGEDIRSFCREAKAKSQAQKSFITQGPWAEDELIYFSCLPWFPITGLTNERSADPTDSIPRVAWGRYEEREGKTFLSLSLDLNHRLVDGYHVGKLYEALLDFQRGL